MDCADIVVYMSVIKEKIILGIYYEYIYLADTDSPNDFRIVLSLGVPRNEHL